jgi:hypothetical protein
MLYNSWGDEFATKNIRDIPGRIKQYDWFQPIDPNDLSIEEMKKLGFNRWNKESGIWLIPLWMHPFLVDMFNYACISDEIPKMGARKDIDTDHRFGCLAYGVVKHEQE